MVDEKISVKKSTARSAAKSNVLKLNIEGVKSSEIYKIIAAVFVIMEECSQGKLELTEFRNTPENQDQLQMSFRKSEKYLDLEVMESFRNRLGKLFTVRIPVRDREATLIQIVGKKEYFTALLQRTQYKTPLTV
ncbi:MAG: hypothetical protein IKH01_00310 [Prevotella sp.]|nr:hypothetical protein [Prevotella sp.]